MSFVPYSAASDLPLSLVSPLVQIGETLYSITIAWGYSPAPLHAPLLGYVITLRSCEHEQPYEEPTVLVTSSNETELTLYELDPGAILCLTVGGWNSVGRGTVSAIHIMSMSGVVPPAPAHVNTSWVLGEPRVVSVSWQVSRRVLKVV